MPLPPSLAPAASQPVFANLAAVKREVAINGQVILICCVWTSRGPRAFSIGGAVLLMIFGCVVLVPVARQVFVGSQKIPARALQEAFRAFLPATGLLDAYDVFVSYRWCRLDSDFAQKLTDCFRCLSVGNEVRLCFPVSR